MANLIGQRFGQYTITATLGSSGMMTLYRARQVSTGRDVVIKVIKPEDSASIERFVRETQKVASLDHPHILKVLDFGMRDGSLYVVMEVKAGGSLAARLKAQGKLDADAVARYLEQISKALDYAYSHGMVYRALKPQNVLLDEDGNAFLTNTAHPLAADQQRERDAARSDILALAAMTYELLTGTLPSTSGAPPRLRQTRPDLPQSLEKVVFRGMAKRPEAQFQSAAEFARAFREALTDPTPKDTDLVAAQRSPTLLESVKAKSTAFVAQRSSATRVEFLLVGAVALTIIFLIFMLVSRSSTPSIVNVERMVELQTFGHVDRVNSVTWSPDGRYLASASIDRTVRVWEIATGRLLRTLEGHRGKLSSVAWSPNGRFIASGDLDEANSTVRIWEADTGQLQRTLTGHTKGVASVAWSPDGRYLASGSWDGTVRIWDAATGHLLRTLKGEAWSVVWSPDSRYLASGSSDEVRIWDVTTGGLLRVLGGHINLVQSVAWSPDGRYLVSGSWDKTVRVWDAMTGELLRNLRGHTRLIWSVAWSPDGRYLASGSGDLDDVDNTVRIWEAATGRLLRTLTGHTYWVTSLAWSPDGRYLASSSLDSTVRIWGVPER
jgi:serine/threonine protein kinase